MKLPASHERVLRFIKEQSLYALWLATYDFDPLAVLAHAGLESGWGQSRLAKEDKNLFGIKGYGKRYETTEYVNGAMKKVVSEFKSYRSYAECWMDYMDLIQRRFRPAWEARDKGILYFSALYTAGYATDPEYSSKLVKVHSFIRKVLEDYVKARANEEV